MKSAASQLQLTLHYMSFPPSMDVIAAPLSDSPDNSGIEAFGQRNLCTIGGSGGPCRCDLPRRSHQASGDWNRSGTAVL